MEPAYTFRPASPESVYSFNMVLLDPPAPAARAEEGRGAAGARRLSEIHNRFRKGSKPDQRN